MEKSGLESFSENQQREILEITKNDQVYREKNYFFRLWLYLKDRFDPGENLPLVVMLYFCQVFIFFPLVVPGTSFNFLEVRHLLFIIVITGFFFNLRVYDEFKDFEEDHINFPERIVVRGIFSLGELKILGILASLIGGMISLTFGMELFGLFLVISVYSFLMAKEFFIKEWLSKRLLIYAASHMIIIPLITLYAAFTVGKGVLDRPGLLGSILLSHFFFLFSLEVGRKIRVPEDERTHYQTYSKIFGSGGAMVFVGILQILAIGCYIPVIQGGFSMGATAFLFLGTLLSFGASLKVFLKPSIKGARDLKKTCALPFIFFLVTTLYSYYPK